MTVGIAALTLLYLCSSAAVAQAPAKSPGSSLVKATLQDIGRAIPSSHIGSPPLRGSPAERVEQWRREVAAYNRVFELSLIHI